MKADLDDANEHLSKALEHHANGHHSSVKRRIELARACIQRAIDGAAIANPTAAQGAQTSNGQQPRAFLSAEERRLRDQQAGIDLCYRERQRQLQGFRR